MDPTPASVPARRAFATGVIILLTAAVLVFVYLREAVPLAEWIYPGPVTQLVIAKCGGVRPGAIARGELETLVASIVLHWGWLHAGFNLFALWVMGRLAESLMGRGPMAAIYVLSGIGGSALSSQWRSGPGISAGASGAIFGLVGAIIASLLIRRDSVPRAVLHGILWPLVLMAVLYLVLGSFIPFVDNAGHVGGLLAGGVAGGVLSLPDRSPARIGRRIAVGLAVALGLVGAAVPAVRAASEGSIPVGSHRSEEGRFVWQSPGFLGSPAEAGVPGGLPVYALERIDSGDPAGAVAIEVEKHRQRMGPGGKVRRCVRVHDERNIIHGRPVHRFIWTIELEGGLTVVESDIFVEGYGAVFHLRYLDIDCRVSRQAVRIIQKTFRPEPP